MAYHAPRAAICNSSLKQRDRSSRREMRSSRRPELADSSGFNGMGSRSDDSYEVQRFLHEYDERFQEDLSLVPGDESSGYHRQQRGAYPQGRNQHVAPEHQHSAILYAPHPHHMPPYSIHRGILTSPVNFYQPEHPFAQANALTDRTEPWSSYNPRRASHQTVSGREVVFAVDDGQRYLHSPSKEPSLSLYRTGSGQSNTRRMSPLSSFGTSSVSSTAAQHHSNKQYSFDMILQSPTPGPEEQSRKAVRGCHSLTPLEVYCGLSWEEKTEGVTQNDSSQLGNGSPTSSYYSSTHPRDLGSGIEQAGIPVYGQPSHLQPGSFASDYRCSTVVGFQDHGHWTEQTGDMSYGPSLEVENRSITGNDR